MHAGSDSDLGTKVEGDILPRKPVKETDISNGEFNTLDEPITTTIVRSLV